MKLRKTGTTAPRAQADALAAHFEKCAADNNTARHAYERARAAALEALDLGKQAKPTVDGGKQITGDKFIIGYTQSAPSPDIDIVALGALLTPKERAKVIKEVKVKEVDERALLELLSDAKRFTKAERDMFLKEKEGAKRVFVRRIES